MNWFFGIQTADDNGDLLHGSVMGIATLETSSDYCLDSDLVLGLLRNVGVD